MRDAPALQHRPRISHSPSKIMPTRSSLYGQIAVLLLLGCSQQSSPDLAIPQRDSGVADHLDGSLLDGASAPDAAVIDVAVPDSTYDASISDDAESLDSSAADVDGGSTDGETAADGGGATDAWVVEWSREFGVNGVVSAGASLMTPLFGTTVATATTGHLYVSSADMIIGAYAGQTRLLGIGRWDGSSWSALPPLPNAGSRGGFGTALVSSGNDLFVGNIWSQTVHGVMRYSETTQTWSPLGTGLSFGVVSAMLEHHGRLFVAGSFPQAGGISSPNLAAWNIALNSWEGLPGSVITGDIIDLAVFNDEVIALGSPPSAVQLMRWDGSGWLALPTVPLPAGDRSVRAVAVHEGRLWAITNTFLMAWDGATWSEAMALEPTTGPTFAAGSPHGLLLSGSFANLTPGSLHTIDVTTNPPLVTAVDTGIGNSNGPVSGLGTLTDVAVQGNTVWLTGSFDNTGGRPLFGVARWTGGPLEGLCGADTLGLGRAVGADGLIQDGLEPQSRAIAKFQGEIVVGGSFVGAGCARMDRIARWNGAAWQNLGDGLNGSVYALQEATGELFAGGKFTASGNLAVEHIARWDGVNWTDVNSGTNGLVRALASEPGGVLYAAGDFTRAGAGPANFLARFDGAQWSAFGSPNAPVHALAWSASSSSLIVGGQFTAIDGVSADHVARWDGAAWHAMGAGLSGVVVQLYVAGSGIYASTWRPTELGLGLSRWDGVNWVALPSTEPSPIPVNARLASPGVAEWDGRLWAVLYARDPAGVLTRWLSAWDGMNWIKPSGGQFAEFSLSSSYQSSPPLSFEWSAFAVDGDSLWMVGSHGRASAGASGPETILSGVGRARLR